MREVRKVLFCLRQLRFPSTQRGLLTPGVEHVKAEVNTESSKVMRQEGDVVLVAVAGESLNIGNPHIRLCQTRCSLRFFHFGTGRKDFWMRCGCSPHAFLSQAARLKFRNRRIKIEGSGQRQAYQVI